MNWLVSADFYRHDVRVATLWQKEDGSEFQLDNEDCDVGVIFIGEEAKQIMQAVRDCKAVWSEYRKVLNYL